MVTWPSSIPQTPVMGNYTETLPNQTVLSAIEGGPTIRRRRSVINTYPIDVVFKMTRTQATTLVSFYKNDIHYGTTPFTWNNPSTSATVTARIVSPPQLTAETFDWYSVSMKFQLLE